MPHKWRFFLEGTPQNHPTAASPLTSKSSAKARVFSSAPSSHGFTMLRWMGELFFGITITTFFRINFCLSLSFLYLLFRLWIAADNPKVVWSIGWWVHDLPQLLVWSHCARKNLVWPSCRWSFPLDFGPKSITAQANHHPKKSIQKKTHLFFFGVEVQTALTSQVWHLQLSVNFRRSVSNFRTLVGGNDFCLWPPGLAIKIKSQLFISGGFLGSFLFTTQGETLIFFVSFIFFPQFIFADYMWFLLFKWSMVLNEVLAVFLQLSPVISSNQFWN